MMTEMVDYVARQAGISEYQARKAIEAMREPSFEMIEAVARVPGLPVTSSPAVWRTMVSAALNGLRKLHAEPVAFLVGTDIGVNYDKFLFGPVRTEYECARVMGDGHVLVAKRADGSVAYRKHMVNGRLIDFEEEVSAL